MKLLLKISGMLGANNDMRQKVDEFTNYIEKLMENYDLQNKEIYSLQPVPLNKQGSDQLKKPSKDLDKIKRDVDHFKKKNANLQKSLTSKFTANQPSGQPAATAAQAWTQPTAAVPTPAPKPNPANLMETKMTPEEIAFLRSSINSLSPEQKNGVIKIVQEWSR